MAIPFSQSMRSLQADRGYASLFGFGIAFVLFALWSVWFFLAPMTRYETGAIVETTRDSRVVAQFPAQAAQSVRSGQRARIHPNDAMTGGVGMIPAVVASYVDSTPDNDLRFSFYVDWDAVPESLLAYDLSGEVAVDVERVSPATLVVRASNRLLDSSAASLNPQQFK